MVSKYQNLFSYLAFLFIFFFWEAKSSSSTGYMRLDLQGNLLNGIQLSGWRGPYTVVVNATYSYQSTYGSALFECSGTTLMTFPENRSYLERSYSGLPPHETVYITMNLWFLDAWLAYDDTLLITISSSSGSTTFSIQSINTAPWPNNSICGSATYQELSNITLNFQIIHTSSNLNIVLEKYLEAGGPSNRTIGLRDVNVLVSNNTIPTSTYCISSPYSDIFVGSECACSPGYYLDTLSSTCERCHDSCYTCSGSSPTSCLSCAPGYTSNGTVCILCDSSCKTCFGPAANQCLTCYERDNLLGWNNSCNKVGCPFNLYSTYLGYDNFITCYCFGFYTRNSTCRGSCPSFDFTSKYLGNLFYTCEFKCEPGTFLHKNGSCLSSCDLAIVNRGGYEYCLNPCPDTLYNYWNGSCLATCNAPLIPREYPDRKVCSFPCSGNEYLFWNGTCMANCNFPLVKKTEALKNYCSHPCDYGQYLYWNGTCLDSCRFPYVATEEAKKLYCNVPCPPSFFLFENGTCIPSCTSPLIKGLNATVDSCRRPCSIPGVYYYPEDKSCKASCKKPYTFNESDLSMSCELVLSAAEIKQVQSINSLNSGSSGVTQGAASVSAIAGDPSAVSASTLTKMLYYTKYINVTHSAKLEMMFRTSNLTTGFVPLIPTLFESLKSVFPYTKVPPTFAKYNVHSTFLFNFWEGFISILFVLCLWTLVKTLEFVAGKLQVKFFPARIFLLIRGVVQNFFLAQFYNCYNDVLMFSALEMRSNDLNSASLVISFVSSLILIGSGLILIYIHLGLILEYQQLRDRALKKSLKEKKHYESENLPESLEKFNKDHDGIKVLFFNFKDASFLHQSFFLIVNLRNSIFSLLIGFLFDYPIVQISVLTCFTALTIFYILIKRPFKIIVNLLQQLFGEVILLIVNISLINMIVLDLSKQDEPDKRDNFSQIIILCNIAIGFVAPVFGAAKVAVAVYDYIKLRRMRKNLNDRRLTLKQINRSLNTTNLSDLEKSQTEAFRTNQGITEGNSSLITLNPPRIKKEKISRSANNIDSFFEKENEDRINPINKGLPQMKRLEPIKLSSQRINSISPQDGQSLIARANKLVKIRNMIPRLNIKR